MNLLEVRTQFVKQTGRYDLKTGATTFEDNGADYYIQAGQRLLDRLLEFSKDEGEMTINLATSAISTTLHNVRSVREIAVADTGDATIRYLTRRSMSEMRSNYGDEVSNLASVTAAEPTSWSLAWLRTNVSRTTTTEGNTKLLITMPPADRTYTLRLRGLFGSPALSANTSVSFWTIQHPDILIWAAMYQLEVAYRNFEGSKAILSNLLEMVETLDNEVVEQGQVEMDQLKDSHRFILPPIRNQDRYF